jgi:hypothetical protein
MLATHYAFPTVDTIFEVIANNRMDPNARDRAQWIKRLADQDLFGEMLIHICERRHWPDYLQLVRMIETSIECELDNIYHDQA